MQLEQRFTLPLPPVAAWAAFQDTALLVECLPGAALTGPAEAGELPLRFDVKLGPIAAGFQGSGRVHLDDAARSGRFEGAAVDRRTQSRVKGAAEFALAPHGGGTQVTVRVDYTLTGALAQFGRAALVREIAGALTQQFAAQLEARLAASAPAATALAPAAGNTAAAPIPAPAPLSLGALLLQVLRARWRRLHQGLFPRGSR